jgi:redox-sensitive bicupin YhaK (pirin superfamily)
MTTVRQARERGKTQTPWPESPHTFSFNRYDDPRYSGFRDLRVINEDSVAPGMGFGTHGHLAKRQRPRAVSRAPSTHVGG